MSQKSSSYKTSILTIGTEITTGQILNGNAKWLAEKLTDLGLDIDHHLSVPDDHNLILSSLKFLTENKKCNLVILAGGLGPTTDDITRNTLASFLARDLFFHPPSWQKIEERLARFGVKISASNRIQAEFPTGAFVLENPKGTANGFGLVDQGITYLVFPGPPLEIASIWETAQIESLIQKTFPDIISKNLLTWQCLGKTEAELGDLTEEILKGSGLTTGYRAHRPYIEIKVWMPKTVTQQQKQAVLDLEKALKPYSVGCKEFDVVDGFLNQLASRQEASILLIDRSSEGALLERLNPRLRISKYECLRQKLQVITHFSTRASNIEEKDLAALALVLYPLSGEVIPTWNLSLKQQNSPSLDKQMSYPYPLTEAIESLQRAQRYVLEFTLIEWTELLKNI